MVDGRNDVEEVRREREVTGDEVEGGDQRLGLGNEVQALQLSHNLGGRELPKRNLTCFYFQNYLKK